MTDKPVPGWLKEMADPEALPRAIAAAQREHEGHEARRMGYAHRAMGTDPSTRPTVDPSETQPVAPDATKTNEDPTEAEKLAAKLAAKMNPAAGEQPENTGGK